MTVESVINRLNDHSASLLDELARVTGHNV